MKRLNVPTSIWIARSIRRASRTTFLLSITLLMIRLPQIDRLTAALAVTVVLAILIYLSALHIGQTLASREFAAALAADPGTNRPIILFLRSFDIAQFSLGSRLMMELGYTAAMLATSTVPRRYEVEENLDEAIGLNAMFVALGDRLASYGAAKITVKDEDWQNIFYRLANASQLIFMMPGPSPGALWELRQIMCSRLRKKTVFIMPPRGSFVKSSLDREWAVLSDAAAELGARFPPYSREGCYFGLPTGIFEPSVHGCN